MKNPFTPKLISKLKEFNKKSLISNHNENGISIIWFSPAFSGERRLKPNLKMHCHTFYEVHLVLDGFIVYQTRDGKEFTVKEGEFLFIPPHSEHILVNESECLKKFGLAFTYSEYSNLSYVFNEEIFQTGAKDILQNVFETISLALKSANGSEAHIINNCIMSFIMYIAKSVETRSVTEIRTDERVIRAKTFIKDNAMRDISVEEVASFVLMSTKHLGRLFIEYEHISVSDFIEKSRCERAKILLNDGSISISEIARRLSFANEQSFNRYFRRTEGITPGTYKKLKEGK